MQTLGISPLLDVHYNHLLNKLVSYETLLQQLGSYILVGSLIPSKNDNSVPPIDSVSAAQTGLE